MAKTITIRPNYKSIYQAMMGSVMATLASGRELTKEDIEGLRGQITVIDEIASPAVTRMEQQLQEEENG